MATFSLPTLEWVSVPQSAAAFTPFPRHRERMPEGGTHAEVGPKSNLSPRGYVNKEEKWKSLYAAVQARIGLVNPTCVEYLIR